MINYRHLIGFVLLATPFSLIAQNQKEVLPTVSFEHVRINVADKDKTAKWYVENMGLEIMESSNTEMVYVADKDHNFMIELSSIPGIRNTYSDVAVDTLHLAFEGHKTIEAVAQKMLAAGGTQDGELYRNQIGDYVINVRDPNGFSTQLLHRVKPFFKKPVNSSIRFEHLAFNTADQKISALWYVEFMNLTIPWSKDIELANHNYRNYRVPYVGDQAGCMSFELFGKEGVPLTFAKMKHQEFHVAFTTDAPEKIAQQMVYGGAKMIGTPQTEPSGDMIVDLVDPIGFPIRLIKRKTAILVR